MPRKIKNTPSTEFETVSTGGFPPMWKPQEEDEQVAVVPIEFRTLSMGKGKKKKENKALDCLVRFTNSESFYVGSGKNATRQKVEDGDIVTIPLSYNLLGENKIAVCEDEEELKYRFSKLSQMAMKDDFPILLIFNGKVNIGGGQTVKQFTIRAPKGVKEKLSKTLDTE